MNGFVLGMAMLLSSTAAPLPLETPHERVLPSAFTFDLPDDAAPRGAQRLLSAPSRPVWNRASYQAAQPATRRFNRTDRIIAVAAGVCVGWIAGGVIGYKLTDNPDNPDDDTSGLRGVIIGAPIGAAIGAILGYRLTK